MEQNNQFIPNQQKEDAGVDELFRWLGDELWPDGESIANIENKKNKTYSSVDKSSFNYYISNTRYLKCYF